MTLENLSVGHLLYFFNVHLPSIFKSPPPLCNSYIHPLQSITSAISVSECYKLRLAKALNYAGALLKPI